MIAIFPEIANFVARGEIENLACVVRKYFAAEQTYSPTLDVEALLKRVGIPVEEMAIDGLGALLVEDGNGRFRVVALINPSVHRGSQRNVLLAHLLGHFLLDLQGRIVRGNELKSGYQLSELPSKRMLESRPDERPSQAAKSEQQADHFALALLMPHGMIKKAEHALKEPARLGQFFDMEVDLVRLRLRQLDLGTEAKASKGSSKSRAIDVTLSDTRQDLPTGMRDSSPLVAPDRKVHNNSPKISHASSIEKGQRLIAGQRYRAQPPSSPVETTDKTANNNKQDVVKDSLKKLREIAKRLDSSVDV